MKGIFSCFASKIILRKIWRNIAIYLLKYFISEIMVIPQNDSILQAKSKFLELNNFVSSFQFVIFIFIKNDDSRTFVQ